MGELLLKVMTVTVTVTVNGSEEGIALLMGSMKGDSHETSASDMMKCLNALRINDASVSTSTGALSPSSIPKLAPPPALSTKSSAHSASSDVMQTWPKLPTRSSGLTSRSSATFESNRRRSDSKGSNQWVAFGEQPSLLKRTSVDVLRAEPSRDSAPSTPPMTNARSLPLPVEATNDSTPWESFGDAAFPTDHPVAASTIAEPMTTVQEDTPVGSPIASHPPPKPPVMRPQKTGSTVNSDAVGEKPKRHPWVDSDDDASSLPTERTQEENPFASHILHKRYSSGCSLASKNGDAAFHTVLSKYGAPQLELVETVNASFSGNKLTRYGVWGEVKFKLSGAASLSTEQPNHVTSRDLECLDLYHLVLRLKCVLHHVYLKHVIAKKSLMDWDDRPKISRQSSLTMNEARKGVVESKIMHWNLGRCYQEALQSPVALLRYPVQPNTLSGPPLKIQIQWQRPRKDGQPVLVDVSVIPNRKLSTSLWGVTVCLKGFGTTSPRVEASACPEAKWNPIECWFEWSIPIINPDDAPQHLKVKVMERTDEQSEYNLSAHVKFVMPHATLSGTLLLGWIERKDENSAPLFGEDTAQETDLIFCEKMCLSGHYGADINYGQ